MTGFLKRNMFIFEITVVEQFSTLVYSFMLFFAIVVPAIKIIKHGVGFQRGMN